MGLNFQYFTVILIVINSLHYIFALDCNNVNGKNFTLITGEWDVRSADGSKSYYINICDHLGTTRCGNDDDVVCAINGEDKISLGKSTSPNPTIAQVEGERSVILNYTTTTDCASNNAIKYQSSITFECSKILGSPELIYSDDCRTDFLWETFLACEDKAIKPTAAVKCYLYDEAGHKHDLSALIKPIGGYKVINPDHLTSDDTGLFINVCQSILTNEKYVEHKLFKNCPDGSTACLIIDGDNTTPFGNSLSPLTIENERLKLKYQGETALLMTKPNITITFICPKGNRGSSKPPMLTSSYYGNYEVEWWTEAACPIETITSDHCQLDSQTHGIDLDLSPLTKSDGNYRVDIPNSDTAYFINVCASNHMSCTNHESKQDSAICQTTGTVGHSGGKVKGFKLQYIDGDLSLKYVGGDACSSNQKRTSIINFKCNETADIGSPLFVREIECLYYFDWDTKYACVAAPPRCNVQSDNGINYDISSLTRLQDQNQLSWEALTGVEDINRDRYFINVCSEVIRSASASSCPEGSAVCLVKKDSAAKSLGSFSHSELTVSNGRLQLVYSHGESCGDDKMISSIINLYCKLGDIESSPVYKYTTADGCKVQFDWHTASACKLATVNGSNCALSDEDSGFTFDLSQLANTNSIKISTDTEYDYYINVCNEIHNTPCDSISGSKHPAACQVKRIDETMKFVTGQVSSQLSYYNGFVRLVYRNGDQYHNKFHRQTQISFLCDDDAGVGTPTFVAETNHTYLFSWYTSYVCPSAPVQCMVTDPATGHQYDLSSLAKSEDDQDANWSVMEMDFMNPLTGNNNKAKYYMNICRPVNNVFGQSSTGSVNHEDGCDVLAGACQTVFDGNGAEHVNITSLGVVTSGPTIESEGHLSLQYENGSICHDDIRYKMQIHFVCRKGQLTTTPRFLDKKNCRMSFLWYTEAACPVNATFSKSDKCEVVDPNSHLTFNLESLNRKESEPYKTTDSAAGVEYQLNVCGFVASCSDSTPFTYGGCQHQQSSTSFSDRKINSTDLQYSDDGSLTLEYTAKDRTGDGNFPSYILSFICDRNAVDGKLQFSRVSGIHTYFNFMTSLACQPEPVDCLVTDNFGNQYDLSPLIRTDKAPWVAYSGDVNKVFYINVCRPITAVENCPSGSLGACLVETDDDGGKLGHNLGLVQSNPTAVSEVGVLDGSTVSIVYTNGDVCKSNPKKRMSTRIIFTCSDEEGRSPVYQSTHDDSCQYLFTWQTPTACKLTPSTGSDCRVTEPLYNTTFDFTSLKAKDDLTVAADDEWKFNIAVCRKLKRSGDDCSESASCQVNVANSNKINDAGKPTSSLTYEDGVISLEYLHGRKCHNDKFERSTVIRFTCDHGDNGLDIGHPSYIHEDDECTYTFDWPTRLACPPVNVVECMYRTPSGDQYDLSSLSQSHGNIVASTSGDVGSRQYFVNVCRTLLHKNGQLCPANAAACVKKDDKFISLGAVSDAPRLNTDGDLVLSYDHGDMCDKSKAQHYRTTIVFRCSHESSDVTTPLVTITEDHDCHLQLLWITKAACKVDTSQPGDTCSVTNPESDHTFSFSSLKKDDFYTVHDTTGKNRDFEINVCGPVVDSKCPANSASCIVTPDGNHMSAGASPGVLSYKDGAIIQTYTNGAECEADNKYKHSTVVSFVCKRTTDPFMAASSAATQPVYIGEDESSCTHYISWHVYEACEVHSPCAVVDSTHLVARIIDLSPLISESGHVAAISSLTNRTGTYFLNLCRPLEPIAGVMCAPGSSVCEITEHEKPKALGFIGNEFLPHYDPVGKTVTIDYVGSEKCPTASNKNVTSKIVLTCVPGIGKGIPRLVEVSTECVYLFEWGTDVVCEDPNLRPPTTVQPGNTKPTSSSDCTYTDPANNVVYDLSKIKPITISATRSRSATYDVSVCTGITADGPCHGEAACKTEQGQSHVIGKLSNREVSPSDSSTVAFVAKFPVDKNDATKPSVEIFFYCDRQLETVDENYNEPHIDDSSTVVRVYWPTPHACPPLSKRCIVTDIVNNVEYDISLLSSISHHYQATDGDGNTYIINVCKPLNVDFDGCDDDATVCRRMKGKSKYQTLGVIESQKSTPLPDDDKSFELRYGGGDTDVCTNNNKVASAIIHFKCSKSTTTQPKFNRFDKDKCVFYFTWESRIACKVEPEVVTIGNAGTFTDAKSGQSIDLSDIFNKHDWMAHGDMRAESSGVTRYTYLISLRGSPNLSSVSDNEQHKCTNSAAVCQTKPNSKDYERMIADSTNVKYTMTDESLEIRFDSNDPCHKDATKHSHVVISMKCYQNSGLGTPQFIYESAECGYFFEWYTERMCVDFLIPSSTPVETNNNEVGNTGSSSATGHSNTAAVVMSLLAIVVVMVILIAVFRKQSRRRSFAAACRVGFWNCCRKHGGGEYRYMPVDEDGEPLMHEVREDSSLLSHVNTTSRTVNVENSFTDDLADDDIFAIPPVQMSKQNKRNNKNNKSNKNDNVTSYHDEDDEDLLEG